MDDLIELKVFFHRTFSFLDHSLSSPDVGNKQEQSHLIETVIHLLLELLN